MNENAQAMVMASFIADSLALGAHWIYDVDKVAATIDSMEKLPSPPPDTYHPNRQRGQFTHYGDQSLLLLESLVRSGGFIAKEFAEDWVKLMRNYDGYMDKASKAALENLEAGSTPELSGSTSSDLGGAARIAPLVYRYQNDLETLIQAARAQTKMTHASVAAITGADFLAKTAYKILHGATPTIAIEESLDEGISDLDLDIRIRSGLDSVGKNSREVIGHFGQMCGIAAALPGVIHLVLTYENDLKAALKENVLAGGDSAARGMATGMLLGAYLGSDAIPAQWLADLAENDRIINLLDKMVLN